MAAMAISFGQIITDLGLLFFSLLAYLKEPKRESKIFFGLLFISILLATISNETYNFAANIFQTSITPRLDALWTLPYVLFLLIQITAWCYLNSLDKNTDSAQAKSWVSRSSDLQFMMVLLLSTTIILIFKDAFLKKLFAIQIVNSLLEVILFCMILPCLIRTKNKAIALIATGFLFAIAFNLAHRFSEAAGHYHQILGILWLICPIILMMGFISALKNGSEKIDFFEKNSIHVLISTFILSATFITFLFGIVGFLMASSGFKNLDMLPEDIASVLVFAFSLSVLLSKLSANYFSSHLNRLAERVNLIQNNASNLDQLTQKPSSVHEIAKLDRFILNTVDQLQTANRVKAEFLRNMSHDFRTPASGIYEMSTSIYKRMPEDKLKGLQKMIVNSSSQLMNLLDEILHYSNLESGNSKSTVEKFDVTALVDEIISFALPKIEEKALSIKTHFPKDSIDYVGDRTLLHRILLNLVSNAIKFTSAGSIEISVSEVLKNSKEFLQIAIKDTGIGIAKEDQAKIFEAFYRVRTNDLGLYSGIGLGLSNVRAMLKEMRGEISLESRLGEGSIFIVQLPFLDA